MNPVDILRLLGLLGDAGGAAIKEGVTSVFDAQMWAIWTGSLSILQGAFEIADEFSIFTVSTTDGPVSVLWPMMLWVSGILALGLFFWQIVTTMLHGGRGFLRLLGGPVQYGVALAATVGLVAAFLAAADGLTDGILEEGLHVHNFQDALHATSFDDVVSDQIKSVAAALAGVFGVVPAGLGYTIEMLFREAAVYVLVATVPLTAAGLLANVTAVWFWRSVRWMLAAIAMKPVLALTLVLGIAIVGGAQGLSGLLAGVGVLLISLCVPLVLFKLFAFVDPNTERGAAFRDQLSNAGVDSYGADSIAGKAGELGKDALKKAFGGGGNDEDEDDAGEKANADRFDRAIADDDADATSGHGTPGDADVDDDDGSPTGTPDTGPADTDIPAVPGTDDIGPPDEGGDDDDHPPPSALPEDVDPTPRPPDAGLDPADGGSEASEAEIADAAVIV